MRATTWPLRAGSGITPILSIIKTTLLHEPNSRFTLFLRQSRLVIGDLQGRNCPDLKDIYTETPEIWPM